MPEHKKSGWKVRIFTLINSEIASQNAKISSTFETVDMSDRSIQCKSLKIILQPPLPFNSPTNINQQHTNIFPDILPTRIMLCSSCTAILYDKPYKFRAGDCSGTISCDFFVEWSVVGHGCASFLVSFNLLLWNMLFYLNKLEKT